MFYIKYSRPGEAPRTISYPKEADAVNAFKLFRSFPQYEVELLGKNPQGGGAKLFVQKPAKEHRPRVDHTKRKGRRVLSIKGREKD